MGYAIRPSSAWIWGADDGCRGYPLMVQQYPEIAGTVDDTVRKEGTAAHWVSHAIGQGYVVPEGTVSPEGVMVDDDMLDGVAQYLGVLRSWGGQVYQETPLPAAWIHPMCGGTPDAWAWFPEQGLVRVADFKYGFRFVDEFECLQGAIYVCAVCEYLASKGLMVLDGYTEQHLQFEFTIVQPRCYGVAPVRTWRGKLSDLRGIWNKLRAAAEEVVAPNPPLRSGPQCWECSARLNCPAFQKASMAAMSFSAQAVPHDLTREQMGNMLRMLRKAKADIESLVDGVEVQLMHAIDQGYTSPHWELSSGGGRRVYKDGAEERLIALGDLYKVNLRKPQRALPITQAEALIDPQVLARFYETRPYKRKLVPFDSKKLRKLGME